MPAQKLSVGDFGDDVAQLHTKLTQSGVTIAPEEIKRKFFGPSTRAAVSELQSANNVEVTGHADEATHVVLASAATPSAQTVVTSRPNNQATQIIPERVP